MIIGAMAFSACSASWRSAISFTSLGSCAMGAATVVAAGRPTWMGCVVVGSPRNAAFNESDTTRYLPSLTCEIEYITTKKASSSVTRSP
jgi:type IV secretory pathway protease TraF